MKPIILYHNDWDGLVSAWSALKSLGSADLISCNYEMSVPDNLENRDVYILDFSFKRKDIEEIKKNANSLLVIDHHKSAEKELNGLDYCRFDMTKSGARLTYEYFISKDYIPELVRYVEDRDLWKFKLLNSKEINQAIQSYPMTLESCDKLDENFTNDNKQKMIIEGKAILRQIDRLIESAFNRAEEITLEGFRGISVNMPVFTSNVAHKLGEDYDFAICWYKSKDKWKNELRSCDDGVDVSLIAEKYGGGGHYHAAGFMSKEPIQKSKNSREFSQEYLEALVKQAKEYLPKDLWKQLHRLALPSAGGKSAWRKPELSVFEKIALGDIRQESLIALDDEELNLAWLRLNQWFASARRRKEAVENYIDATSCVLRELKKRDMDIDDSCELAQMAFVRKQESDGDTDKFWNQHWQDMYPKSGSGKFAYQRHWRGLSEDETNLEDTQLLRTDHSLHGDLRFTKDNKELWGFAVFLGKAEENKIKDRLIGLKSEDKLRGSPKQSQSHDWLSVGIDEPYVVEPGEAGATTEAFAKIFSIDSGDYDMGVWHRHLIEVFPKGKDVKGRLLFQSVPIEDGKRAWMISRPEDQTPIAESKDMKDVLTELRARGHKWLIWAKPGERPKKIEVKTGRIAKSALVPIFCSNNEKQILYSVVAEPDSLDAHNERLSSEEIEQSAHAFMDSLKIGIEHRKEAKAKVVENIIIPHDVKIFYGKEVRPGSWIVGIHIIDSELWKEVKNGEFTGLSFGGYARKIQYE